KKKLYEQPLADKKFVSWLGNKTDKTQSMDSLLPISTSYFSFDLDSTSYLDFSDKKKKGKAKKVVESKAGKYAGGLFIDQDHQYNLGIQEYLNGKEPFTISFWYYSKYYLNKNNILSKIDQNTGHGIDIDFRFIKIYTPKSDKETGVKLVSKERIPDLEWVHLAISYDGSGKLNGFSFYINGEPIELVGEKDQRVDLIVNESPLIVGANNGLKNSGIDELHLFDRKLEERQIESLYKFNPINPLTKSELANLSKAQKSLVLDHYLYNEDRELGINLRNLEAVKYKKLDTPENGELVIMTMADMPEPNKTYILKRGAYDAPAEEVFPSAPESILSFSDSLPKNRLGLAQWLLDPKNPLTSRVTVNRYWEYIFGRGIVKTVEDFGNQGKYPSHPQLLDWLASTFMENGWDTKAMIKLMVMSSTYQQKSATSKQKRKVDPENIYLARGTRYRMSGNMIRDQALAASGLLNRKVGGPGVRPYQPENLWSDVTAVGGGPLAKYVLDVTKDLYRRSLYTFWKRTVPPPSMLTFDAATRDRCTLSMQSTNTPLQALVLLNDPQYMEAARVMAQNLMADHQSPEANISLAFRKLTGRKPKEKELNILKEEYDKNLESFATNPELIDELLNIGEYFIHENLDPQILAAHTVTFSTILNLDETISKE
ncbi:MAG: hypothetical protein ACI9FN_002450, partial [Saprospiraceae bacterium]